MYYSTEIDKQVFIYLLDKVKDLFPDLIKLSTDELFSKLNEILGCDKEFKVNGGISKLLVDEFSESNNIEDMANLFKDSLSSIVNDVTTLSFIIHKTDSWRYLYKGTNLNAKDSGLLSYSDSKAFEVKTELFKNEFITHCLGYFGLKNNTETDTYELVATGWTRDDIVDLLDKYNDEDYTNKLSVLTDLFGIYHNVITEELDGFNSNLSSLLIKHNDTIKSLVTDVDCDLSDFSDDVALFLRDNKIYETFIINYATHSKL